MPAAARPVGWESELPPFPYGDSIAPIPDAYKCPISGEVMQEPVGLVPCGHTFEKSLIQTHIAARGRNATCPLCRIPCSDSESHQFTSAPTLKQLIRESVHVKCARCGESTSVDNMPSHAREHCPNAMFRCVLGGAKRGLDGTIKRCNSRVQRASLEEHRSRCGYVPVPCPHEGCEVTPIRRKLAEHVAICEYRDVTCACDAVLRLKDLKGHMAGCAEVPVECDLCGLMVARRELHDHLARPESVANHMAVLADENRRLQRELGELRRTVQDLQQSLGRGTDYDKPGPGAQRMVVGLDAEWALDPTPLSGGAAVSSQRFQAGGYLFCMSLRQTRLVNSQRVLKLYLRCYGFKAMNRKHQLELSQVSAVLADFTIEACGHTFTPKGPYGWRSRENDILDKALKWTDALTVHEDVRLMHVRLKIRALEVRTFQPESTDSSSSSSSSSSSEDDSSSPSEEEGGSSSE